METGQRSSSEIGPRYRVNSILSVLELVALGLGVGIVPLFLADGRKDVVRLTEPLDECETGRNTACFPGPQRTPLKIFTSEK